MIINHRACGFCMEFTLTAAATSTCRQGNPGNAGTTVEVTQRPCVLYRRAADLPRREKLVAKHQQPEPA